MENSIFSLGVGRDEFSFRYGRKHSRQLLSRWQQWHETSYDTETGITDGTMTWTDPDTGLEVRIDVVSYPAKAIEWVFTFTNNGDNPTPILENIQACRVQIPGDMGWRKGALLHRLNGSTSTAEDWLPYTTEIEPGTWERWGPTNGYSSSGACPFFALQWDGGGVITAIGWSGQWRAQLAWGTKTELMIGMEHLHLSLEPGESIRTPRIMQLWWKGDEVPYKQFREAMIDHILPRIDGELVMPPIAHLGTVCWEWNSSNEKNTLEHLESIEGLGFDTFWMDAYWFEGGFPHGVGNYSYPIGSVIAKDRFPNGMASIANKVHQAEMDWLLWFAPELVMPSTYLDREHPEWLLSVEGEQRKLFNLGHPAARDYMTQYLIDSVREHRIDWLRIDCCPAPLSYWSAADEKPDRVGITEIRYVEGLYQMLDDILKAHPHLKIDNCDGGGRRIDLEMCKRTTPLWRTDYSLTVQENTGDFDWGAVVNQAQIAGLNRYVPFNGCGAIFEEPYWFRSAFNAGIGFADDCRGKHYPREVLRSAVKEAKRIQKYFSGNFYPLTPVTLDTDTWHVAQYHRPYKDDGIILAFRRHECRSEQYACSLREIDARAVYEVTLAHNYTRSDSERMSGVMLQLITLEVTSCPGSVLVEYRRMPDVS